MRRSAAAAVPPQRKAPPNAALAEALFRLSEKEAPGDRRVALLKAGYAAFDAPGPARVPVMDGAPPWLQPLISQLLACPGEGALDAAVERLSSGFTPRRTATRERFLARAEVAQILAEADPDLAPERMRGAYHWHTTDSDGKASLQVMARTCRRRGASWAVVTDHSRGLEVASGLDREGIRLQRRRIERVNRDLEDELIVLQGIEVEILEDGGIDVPAAERAEVDMVVAAIHRDFDTDRDHTERLLRAVSTPGVHALAHPRGRHFHHRQGIRARWERVFDACSEHGVAVEINGFPRRQDLDWDLAGLALRSECDFVLASDAHAPQHLEFDAYASAIAARAGIPPSRVLNRLQADAMLDWLAIR
jgi:histidinol phosphatase-like PHP family hydrolase